MELTIIVPVHKIEENDKALLTKALTSVKNLNGADDYEVMFVGPDDVLNTAKEIYANLGCKQEVKYVHNSETDFMTQVNTAAMQCITKYFSILEFDDEYTPAWFKTAEKYINEKPDLSVILPIAELVTTEGRALSFANELTWATSFNDSEKLGTVDEEGLKIFMDFNVTGGIIKTEDFISIGRLKKSLKLATWYEYLLRSVYKNKPVYVVPCIGYLHTIERDGSYMVTSRESISQEEGKWLIDTARMEYFFTEDKNKTFGEYVEETEKQ